MELDKNNNQVVQSSVDAINETGEWIPFSSSYFNLSFRIPEGFEVVEDPIGIRIAKSPYTDKEIGGDNAFFYLRRYEEEFMWGREDVEAYFREGLQSVREYTVTIDNTPFLAFQGDGMQFSADQFISGKNTIVFFDASYVHFDKGNDESLENAVEVGEKILSTFRFSK